MNKKWLQGIEPQHQFSKDDSALKSVLPEIGRQVFVQWNDKPGEYKAWYRSENLWTIENAPPHSPCRAVRNQGRIRRIHRRNFSMALLGAS